MDVRATQGRGEVKFGGGKRVMALFGMGVLTFVVGVIASTGIGGVLVVANDWSRSGTFPTIASEADGLNSGHWYYGWTTYNANISGPGLIEIVWDGWSHAIMTLLRAMFQLQIESAALICMVITVSAAPVLLIAPVCKRWQPGEEGRSLRASIAGAAAIGSACAIGILLTAGDLLTFMLHDIGVIGPNGNVLDGVITPVTLLCAWVAIGVLWAWLLSHAGSSRHPGAVTRWVRWLFAGSCVEIAIAAPTYVLAIRRDTCYCSWGSWWAIVAGTTTMVLLCGPALVLLATRQTRMQWMRSVCSECGYPRRGNAPLCTECGKPVPA
jgi:hypothetical protein